MSLLLLAPVGLLTHATLALMAPDVELDLDLTVPSEDEAEATPAPPAPEPADPPPRTLLDDAWDRALDPPPPQDGAPAATPPQAPPPPAQRVEPAGEPPPSPYYDLSRPPPPPQAEPVAQPASPYPDLSRPPPPPQAGPPTQPAPSPLGDAPRPPPPPQMARLDRADEASPPRQIDPGHAGLSLAVPGAGPPALPAVLPDSGAGLPTVVAADPHLALRLRADPHIFLRASVGLAAGRAGDGAPGVVAVELGAGAERHFGDPTARLSPYVGGWAEVLLVNGDAGPDTAIELGAAVGLEVFVLPQLSVMVEHRLGLSAVPGEGKLAFGTGTGGLWVNLYF